MGNPLRDVIARFTTTVDTSQLDTLDSKLRKLKGNVGALAFGANAALLAIGAASFRFIQAASDVSEQQNKIEALFGKAQQQQIIAWSKTVEKSMGRSEFAFQSSFSDFAAFLDPMQIGIDKTIEMSKRLAELKVDLASFYNTSEEDAQMRLFSGISGETEAVRRLGIDISDTALANLYNSDQNPLDPMHRAGQGAKGVNKGKGIAAMTLQQKALLRYTKILMDTKKAQGDAARTATGWANTLKRLTDRFSRLEVAIGKLVEGPGVGFLNLLEGLVTKSEDLAKNSSALQAAIVLLGGAAVYWTTAWATANAALLTSILPIAGVIAALYLVVESFMTLINKDESETGFGYFIKWLEDIERPGKIARDLLDDIDNSIGRILEKMRNQWWNPLGAVQRAAEAMTGGRSFSDDTKRQWGATDSIAGDQMARAGEERMQRLKMAQAGNWEEFRRLRRADQTPQDAFSEYKEMRAPWLAAHPEQSTEKDMSAGIGRQFSRAPSMSVGGITVSPVTHVHVAKGADGGVDIGTVEKIVRRVNTESAVQAAAALRRYTTPQGVNGQGQ